MCTWFYVESKPLSQYIEKAKTSPLANDIKVPSPMARVNFINYPMVEVSHYAFPQCPIRFIGKSL